VQESKYRFVGTRREILYELVEIIKNRFSFLISCTNVSKSASFFNLDINILMIQNYMGAAASWILIDTTTNGKIIFASILVIANLEGLLFRGPRDKRFKQCKRSRTVFNLFRIRFDFLINNYQVDNP
jgi:hypothetical protein